MNIQVLLWHRDWTWMDPCSGNEGNLNDLFQESDRSGDPNKSNDEL